MFEMAPTGPPVADDPRFPPWDLDAAGADPVDGTEPPYSPARAQPSGWLALELDTSTLDVDGMDDDELVDAIVAFDRVASWASARQARLLAEFARRRPGDDPQAVFADRPSLLSPFAPDEIGLALSLSRGTAMSRLGTATHLDERLPATLAAWEEGRLDQARVRAIVDATVFLPPGLAVAVQERVLPRAPEQTTAQLRAALARAVIAADPEGAAARHREARTGRRVCLGTEPEGMASLWALLSAPDATSAYRWLTELARGLGADDPRGMDARRADLLVDLLTGGLTITAAEPGATEPGGPDEREVSVATEEVGSPAGSPPELPATRPVAPGKPLVQVVVPLSTLTGADEQPAELVGYGPIPGELAREIATDAVWRRLVTDPLSGTLLDHGRRVYHPPAALSDFVRARDLHCRFPTCRRRAIDGELDHAVRFPEGPTSEDNLWDGCRHHHTLKHRAGWRVTLQADARLTWVTPTGHTYTSHPHDYRPDPPLRPPAAAPAAIATGEPDGRAPPGGVRAAEDEPPF